MLAGGIDLLKQRQANERRFAVVSAAQRVAWSGVDACRTAQDIVAIAHDWRFTSSLPPAARVVPPNVKDAVHTGHGVAYQLPLPLPRTGPAEVAENWGVVPIFRSSVTGDVVIAGPVAGADAIVPVLRQLQRGQVFRCVYS